MPSDPQGLLFDPQESRSTPVNLSPGAAHLPGFAADQAEALMDDISAISSTAPFRQLVTPGGWPMSVAMTNCGAVGWVSDRSGYRYEAIDPETGRPWPAMPARFGHLAAAAAQVAGYEKFSPDACLINRYAPGSRLSLHQDRNERNFNAPIVSVSLGIPLTHGDVVVWGGSARMTFHGVSPLSDGHHAMTGRFRFNLTFRRAL